MWYINLFWNKRGIYMNTDKQYSIASYRNGMETPSTSWAFCDGNTPVTDDIMTSSNGNIFRVTGHLCGEFTGPGEFSAQRPVTRSFDVFFDLRLNKRLSKQPWGWWFETPSWSLWCQCNEFPHNSPVMWSFAGLLDRTIYWLNPVAGHLICISLIMSRHWQS